MFVPDTSASHGHYKIWKLERPYPEQKLRPNGLSVVMPSYNRRPRLKRALESLFAQEPNGLPLEVLVIDDGSTDNTSELFESPLEGKPDWIDVRYFQTGVPEWTSPANSYNIGFKNAKYNYMVHSGADIIWYKPNMFKDICLAADLDRYLVVNYYELEGPRDNCKIGELLPFCKKKRTTLYPWLVVTSAEALERVGYYEDNFKPGAGEDDAFIMKMHAIGIKFCRLSSQLIINQEHPKQYVRDGQWKQNTQWNLGVGYNAVGRIRSQIKKGEIKKFQ